MFHDFERQIQDSGILLQNALLSTHISTSDICAVAIHLSLPQRLNYDFATYMPTLLDNQKASEMGRFVEVGSDKALEFAQQIVH